MYWDTHRFQAAVPRQLSCDHTDTLSPGSRQMKSVTPVVAHGSSAHSLLTCLKECFYETQLIKETNDVK